MTKLGKKFLKKPTEFLIVEDNDFEDYDDSMEQGGTGVADEMLYKMLLDQRKKEAAKHDLPPYVVFLDASIEAMATLYPIKKQSLHGNLHRKKSKHDCGTLLHRFVLQQKLQ